MTSDPNISERKMNVVVGRSAIPVQMRQKAFGQSSSRDVALVRETATAAASAWRSIGRIKEPSIRAQPLALQFIKASTVPDGVRNSRTAKLVATVKRLPVCKSCKKLRARHRPQGAPLARRLPSEIQRADLLLSGACAPGRCAPSKDIATAFAEDDAESAGLSGAGSLDQLRPKLPEARAFVDDGNSVFVR
jgi:hypothetical protein